MPCLNPIVIEDKAYKYKNPLHHTRFIQVPCGHCSFCQMTYANDWAFRLNEEAKDWKYYAFGTFTYSPDQLDNSDLNIADIVDYQGSKVPLYSLNKKQFQKYLNSVKCTLYRKKLKWKYFCCGEYG